MIFILVWSISSFTWNMRNRMLFLNYIMKLMMMNTCMLIDCAIVGEYVYVKFVEDCIYNMWMVMTWWTVCVNICIVVESYVHAFMTDGDRLYIQLRWLWCVVGIMGWRPRRCWWRYRMHLEVVSRNISCRGMSPCCYNNWCSIWMWLIDWLHVADVVNLCVVYWMMFGS